MSLLFTIAYVAVLLYTLLLFARLVIEWITAYSRSFRPRGLVAAGLEMVYILTDPPVKAVRRLVPPLRLGAVSLDLGLLILLLLCSLLMRLFAMLAG